ncbi:hypothetical protein B0O99DRAFT_619216 [Bisporella sp. PMI_857]|nr:hypothetical protein B0O99DRAFT_619216 [Bisporella sp. PMI_857]
MLAATESDPRILKTVLSQALYLYKLRTESQSLSFSGRLTSFWPFDPPIPEAFDHFGPNSIRVVGGTTCMPLIAAEPWQTTPYPELFGIVTPLLRAIRSRLPKNVQTLLSGGANPNGVPLDVFSDYAAFFLRFRPSIPPNTDTKGDVASLHTFLYEMDLAQLSPITMEEIEDRLVDGMAPFWCEEGFTPSNIYPNGSEIHSLVAAAHSGSVEIFDMLLKAGADCSAWMLFAPSKQFRESHLSISTPIHAAIARQDEKMVRHLFQLGFDPNAMAYSNPTRCHTPLMATILTEHQVNKKMFDFLMSHRLIIPDLRTPIYKVHLLHFAVARLDLVIIKHIAADVPLCNAGVTALGHNLLHIACLPKSSKHVQRNSELIYRSIHETRNLLPTPDLYAEWPRATVADEFFYTADFAAQDSVVEYLLLQHLACCFFAKDIHGNTPLHYLAGYIIINAELVSWLRSLRGVEEIWTGSRNLVGATPADLMVAGDAVKRSMSPAEEEKPPSWLARERRYARMNRKQQIWKDILGDRARREL